jgi:hypothetical protein
MVFLTTMLTTADVNIHASIAKYGIDIQIVRPEMTKFKMFRVKVNMDLKFTSMPYACTEHIQLYVVAKYEFDEQRKLKIDHIVHV